jgi:hypothetical protein
MSAHSVPDLLDKSFLVNGVPHKVIAQDPDEKNKWHVVPTSALSLKLKFQAEKTRTMSTEQIETILANDAAAFALKMEKMGKKKAPFLLQSIYFNKQRRRFPASAFSLRGLPPRRYMAR